MPTRARSITRTSIIILLCAVVVSALISVQLLLTRNTNVIAQTEIDNLVARAEALASSLRRNPQGSGWQLRLSRDLAARFDPNYRRSFYAILDRSGRPLLSSMDPVPGEVPFVIPNAESDEVATFRLRRGGMVLQGISLPVTVEDVPLVIQVADNVEHPDRLTDDVSNEFLWRVSWVILPVFAGLALVAVAMLRLGMRTVERLSRQAAMLASGPPSARLSEEGMPRELLPLVRAMNAMLARADHYGRVQREFTAEAAHQMRTPLAVLMTHAELVQDRRAGVLLANDVAALERIVEQLLALAEIDAVPQGEPGHPIDLLALAEAAAGFLRPLAERLDVALTLEAPDGRIVMTGHEEPLYQAVLNLIQNALDHSPAGETVHVTVRAPVILEVADRGSGIPTHQRQLVFRRFWKGGGERRGGRRGAGLGLAIVQRVANLHGGTVTILDNPGGGTLMRLTIGSGPPEPQSGA